MFASPYSFVRQRSLDLRVCILLDLKVLDKNLKIKIKKHSIRGKTKMIKNMKL